MNFARLRLRYLLLLVFCALSAVAGQSFGEEVVVPPGSTAFCPFELPSSGEKRVFINLGIIQYVEVLRDEVRISYGGGNLGSGHEARLPIKNADEANILLRRLKQAAADCQRKPI